MMVAFWFYFFLLGSTVLGNWIFVRVRARRRLYEAKKLVRQSGKN